MLEPQRHTQATTLGWFPDLKQLALHIDNIWLALEIGNSRLHWGLFIGETLHSTWDTEYLPKSVISQLAQSQTLDDLLLQIFPTPNKTSSNQANILNAILRSPPVVLKTRWRFGSASTSSALTRLCGPLITPTNPQRQPFPLSNRQRSRMMNGPK
ncbi:hypothetical protein VF13_34255 [Nostoc linckia z16]|nr:hypothetical protein VF13_34255 [Nostoc linckia z16]